MENSGGMLKKTNAKEGDFAPSVFHIENLKSGYALGILEVASFSPTEISLKISSGEMEIHGCGLEIKSYNVESGELTFSGEIHSVSTKRKKEGFFERIFK